MHGGIADGGEAVTTHDRDDETLRSALAELRAEERAGAPPFDRVLARRTHRPGSPGLRPMLLGLVAAGLVLLASGTAYRAIVARKRLTVPREVAALAAWRPATDVLLATPGSALLRSSPDLGLSLLGAMPVLDTRPGDQR
jgi:hypothetical protein